MLRITSAGKRFGEKLLFEKADWQITPRERTGLVGGNGSGKSTLLRILAGLEPLDDGTLERSGSMRIGYLPQDGLQLSGRTVFEECVSVFVEAQAVEREIAGLHERIAELSPDSREYGAAAHLLARREAQFHAAGGYTLEAQAGVVLSGLGFSKEDWSRRTEEFSGGWQMRIALAKLLLEEPELLLLDEPTNHLDLEARNWLEEYLRNYPHAYVLISHDRFFLDVATNATVELWNNRLYSYRGNYEKYLRQKSERLAQMQAAYRHQRDHIEHLEAFISRFRAQATKARQVQSRIKELERIDRIELPEEEPVIHFTFPQPPPSGRTVLEARDLGMAYGAKQVFSDVRFTIERGERIALIGPNGAGKSTLMRLLSGIEPPGSGEIRTGHNVVLQYFAQDQYKELDAGARMLDDIGRSAPRIPQTELRNLLGCFLFSGDEVYKPLGVLSGGERNRYALARMLVSPANFLLLDEPTNHLDMRAKDVLLEAIRGFSGTVVFVSHDRGFIDALATRVFEIRDGRVHIYTGNYEDFLWQTTGKPRIEPTETNRASGAAGDSLDSAAVEAPVASESAEERPKRLNPQRLRQMRERCDVLEEEIPRLEAALRTVESEMAVYVSAEHQREQASRADRLREDHADMLAEWEDLAMQLEAQSALA